MTIVFAAVMSPIVWFVGYVATYIYERLREKEKRKMNELDEILCETKTFAITEEKKPKKLYADPQKVEKVAKTNEEIMMTNTRTDMLKGLAVMALVAGCAVAKLMHPVLYVPIEVISLCAICIKYGEYRGYTNARKEKK